MRYEMPTREDLASPAYRRQVLEQQLSVWELRQLHGSNPDADRAVNDLRAKIAALGSDPH